MLPPMTIKLLISNQGSCGAATDAMAETTMTAVISR